jgi:predicted flap endonuclease-1-like 5' DNA nuclease
MANISEIKGLDEQSAEKLNASGISSMDAYLSACAEKKGRKELAEKTGIEEASLLHWANRADLSRIKGVSTQYGDLLECAGVDTVPELAQRNAENLHAKMTEVNSEKNLVKKLPTADQVQDWVTQAKALPRAINY